MLANIIESSESLREAIVFSLVESLWTGAVMILMVWALRTFFKPGAAKRYVLSLVSLIAFLVLTLNNFILHYFEDLNVNAQPYDFMGFVLGDNAIEWIYAVWLIGCVIFILRFLLSYLFLKRLIAQSTTLQDARWLRHYENICHHFNQSKNIILIHSNRIGSAFVTGVLKPVIIVPTSWINQLEPKEIECILAHEISHICSKDHWINLFIQLIEIVFYFNPAVHIFISHIKLDRELLADEKANAYIKSPLLYAKLILKVEEQSGLIPLFSIPFFRQQNQLRRRIESLLSIRNTKTQRENTFSLIVAISCLLFFCLIPNDKKDNTICQPASALMLNEIPVVQPFIAATINPPCNLAKVQKSHKSQLTVKPKSASKKLEKISPVISESSKSELAYVKIIIQQSYLPIHVNPEAPEISDKVIQLLQQQEVYMDSIPLVDGDGAWIISNQGKSFHKLPAQKILFIRTESKKNDDTHPAPTNQLYHESSIN